MLMDIVIHDRLVALALVLIIAEDVIDMVVNFLDVVVDLPILCDRVCVSRISRAVF